MREGLDRWLDEAVEEGLGVASGGGCGVELGGGAAVGIDFKGEGGLFDDGSFEVCQISQHATVISAEMASPALAQEVGFSGEHTRGSRRSPENSR